jgi:hypothetical protein
MAQKSHCEAILRKRQCRWLDPEPVLAIVHLPFRAAQDRLRRVRSRHRNTGEKAANDRCRCHMRLVRQARPADGGQRSQSPCPLHSLKAVAPTVPVR